MTWNYFKAAECVEYFHPHSRTCSRDNGTVLRLWPVKRLAKRLQRRRGAQRLHIIHLRGGVAC